jgi:hypothetical protein
MAAAAAATALAPASAAASPTNANVAFALRYAKAHALEAASAQHSVAGAALRTAFSSGALLEWTPPSSEEMATLAYMNFMRIWDGATAEQRAQLQDDKENLEVNRALYDTPEQRQERGDTDPWRCAGCQTLWTNGDDPLACSEVFGSDGPESDGDHEEFAPDRWACAATFCNVDCRDDYILLHIANCPAGVHGHVVAAKRLVRANKELDDEKARHDAAGAPTDRRAEAKFQSRMRHRTTRLGRDEALQRILMDALKKQVESVPRTAVGAKRATASSAGGEPAAKKCRVVAAPAAAAAAAADATAP